jgi:hypothetical protein
MRYMAIAQQPQRRLALSPSELVSESLVAPLAPRFEKALRDRAFISFSDFADGVLAENPGYAGVGSLGTAESLTVRNSPLLEVAPDVVVPLGLRCTRGPASHSHTAHHRESPHPDAWRALQQRHVT